MKAWTCAFYLAGMATLAEADSPAMTPDLDDVDDEPYDPTTEPPAFACKRNPRWQSNYEECQEYTEWYADDVWTRVDRDNTEAWLQENEVLLVECLDQAFAVAKEKYEWAKCDEDNKTEICEVDTPAVMAHYFREGQGESTTARKQIRVGPYLNPHSMFLL